MNPSKTIKIATFNANSLRARLQIVLDWLTQESPDVLAIQETKVQDHEFPLAPFKEAGWNVIFRGQKSYNGVAFISKTPLTLVTDRLYPGQEIEEARFLHCKLGEWDLVNTYIPQGFLLDSEKFQYKLKFFKDLKNYLDRNISDKNPALWMGDLNVALTEIDLARPKENADHVCFHVEARNAIQEVMNQFWIDLFRQKVSGPGHYTFWDYRMPSTFSKNLGWRIDYILGNAIAEKKLQKIWIDLEPRKKEKPSDHTFLSAEFSL